MTYKAWERALRKELHVVSRIECERTLEYYREMKDEKQANGESEETIVAEFGSPRECARRVALANGVRLEDRAEEETPGVGEIVKRYSPAELVGLGFVTLILILPLFSVLFSVLVAFAAVTASGFGIAIGGVGFAIGAPIMGVASGIGLLAYVGAGIAMSGLGILLCIGFAYATKYTAIGMKKLLIAIYVRR